MANHGIEPWCTWENKAESMSIAELHHAILDCQKAAKAGRSIDIECGGDREGRYHDEMSVYSTEMNRRNSFQVKLLKPKGGGDRYVWKPYYLPEPGVKGDR